jgi:hypothetical protein
LQSHQQLLNLVEFDMVASQSSDIVREHVAALRDAGNMVLFGPLPNTGRGELLPNFGDGRDQAAAA